MAAIDQDALQTVSDELEIITLGNRFADYCNRKNVDDFGSLWTEDGEWTPNKQAASVRGPGDSTALLRQLLDQWDFFVQLPTAPVVAIDGDTATSHWTVQEHGSNKATNSGYFNYGLYDDTLVRTPEGWRYSSRVYTHVYMDLEVAPGFTV